MGSSSGLGPIGAAVGALLAGSALGVSGTLLVLDLTSDRAGPAAPNPYDQPPVSGGWVPHPEYEGQVVDSWGIECAQYMLDRVDAEGLYACDFSTPSPFGPEGGP